MRNAPNLKIDRYRVREGDMGSCREDGNNGAFLVGHLLVIASDGLGWDHVSVSCKGRCPTWDEMCGLKDLFFRDDEVVVQFHPAKKNYVNETENCLHLWRQQNVEIPMPPLECV